MLVESDATAVTQVPQTQPALALPPRPRRPLSSWQLFRTFPDNAVAACDEELFEELLVERRFFWGRLFVVSDPDGIHHSCMPTSTITCGFRRSGGRSPSLPAAA